MILTLAVDTIRMDALAKNVLPMIHCGVLDEVGMEWNAP
jgi:hypothetical protein